MTREVEVNIELIWSQYRSSLKAFLAKNVANLDDVDDLLQEILIKSYHSLDKLNDAKKLKSWLFQIANRTIIDFYRSRASYNKGQVTGSLYENTSQQHSEDSSNALQSELAATHSLTTELIESEDIYQQMSACITPFINALPSEQAELLTAVELNGEAQKDYAARKQIKYSTLKSRVQKSRQALHGLLNQCCKFTLDAHGNLIEYTPKSGKCC
ncbi:sigma-70 family RNA polymerase sigma factor [Shewanella maritima]|uniref:Sigma-70 family RNA polymerase sigma factor n=1 Tax=Shewanella maritima TaxID=2520507 RepID=A0A411PGV4_9GAMM|nr:sigma-70 family RNA polymerase sigma factor [Shewanella maritima]QBF82807.1 sigma-70 family RNA polymerase sigma factor [Shewanella maritima]